MIPFNSYDLFQILEKQNLQIGNRVEKFSNEEMIANDLDILADYIYEEFHIDPVVIFDEDLSKRQSEQLKFEKRSIVNSDRVIEIDEILVKFYFPFKGNDLLFKCRASTFTIGSYPNIEIIDNHLVLSIQKELQLIDEKDTKWISKIFDKNLSEIKEGVNFANKDVEEFNSKLRSKALNLLQRRKNKVDKYNSFLKLIEIPIKRTEYAIKYVPIEKKIIKISSKPDAEKSYQIADEEYQAILEIIKHNGSTYERTPGSYRSMDEENLRDILLAALNGMYKGRANGEAFRNKGKTDICIEAENRAAFIAECKMWKGQKQVEEAIDQLDSYLTWRDCKNALIYFVRNKNFIAVTESMETALKNYHGFRQIKILDQNEFDLTYYSKNPGQLVGVRVMLFNLYCEN